MTSAQVVPLLIIPFIGWRIYTRIRRNIGRQPYHPRRWVTTIVIFFLFTAFVGLMAMRSLTALESLGGGLLIGAVLALVAFRLTRFEKTPEGHFYTPNIVIGLAVTLLFLGRLAYRFTAIVNLAPGAAGDPTGVSYYQNPITLLTFGVTAGYYIAYNASLLIGMRKNS